MSDQTPAPEGQEAPAPELSPAEIEAMESGWRPEEEFKADPKNEGKRWRTAEDFNDRKSFFDKIEESKRETKQLKAALQQLSGHHANVAKLAKEEALKELRAERKAAAADNDVTRVEEIRDREDALKAEIAQIKPPVQVSTLPPEYLEFERRNSWYKKDDRLTRYADALGRELVQEGSKTPEQIFKAVEKEVRETFPEKFRNSNRDDAPEMVPSGRRAPETKGFRLTDEQERIVKTFVGQGIMTREQYIAELKKLQGN